MHKYTFTKEERITSRSAINSLFEQDNAELYSYPLKVRYRITTIENGTLPKFGVIVPKRKFKKAVDRNTLKRRIREAYRLNNALLKEASIVNGYSLEMMVLYMSATEELYPSINKSIVKLLAQLTSKIENVHTTH